MPESKIESNIAKLYKRNTLNLLMFGYVRGVRNTLHTITIEAALEMFRDDMKIDPDDFNAASMATIYNRMTKELLDK